MNDTVKINNADLMTSIIIMTNAFYDYPPESSCSEVLSGLLRVLFISMLLGSKRLMAATISTPTAVRSKTKW